MIISTILSSMIVSASWYSDWYNGRLMSNGVAYNSNKISCASNNYPLGTRVKVTNIYNKNSINCFITDRMSHKLNHRIDLSKRAFNILSNNKTSLGLIKVRVQIIK